MAVPPVARFTLTYAAGLAAGHVLPWIAPALLAPGIALVAWRRGPWRAALIATLLVGAWQGGVGRAAAGRGCGARWSAGRRAAYVRVRDAPSAAGGVTQAEVRYAPEGCGGVVRVRFVGTAPASGATLLAVGDFAPGGAWHLSHWHALSRPRGIRYVLRDLVSGRIARLYGERAPMVDALVLARRGGLAPEVRATFAASGLAHLLAISGLHVGIVAAWLALVGRLAGLRRAAPLVALVATWAYVAVLGFPAPATRAAAFLAVGVVATRRQRHPHADAVLAVAGWLVLLVDPAAVTSAGAWLSVAAVWGSGLAGRRLPPARRTAVWRLLAASVGATLATAPVTAWAFGAVAPIGVVLNLLAVPLAGITVPAVFVSLAVPWMAPGAGLALAGLERLAILGAAVPGGHVSGDPGWRAAAPWVALLLAVLWWHHRRPRWPVLRVRLAAGACVVAWLSVSAGRGDTYRGLTLYVLSVGQGDAIVLRTPHGRWVVVDGGPRTGSDDAGRRVVVPFLRAHGARALAALVLSHGDADHLGGVPSVLARLPAELVLEPGQPVTTALYREYLETVDRTGAGWRAARAGDSLMVDGIRLVVLHPAMDWARRETRTNENSVVVRVSYGEFDALLTGDAGAPAESAFVRRVEPVELLKVGHHGSAGSSTTALLAAARPKVAVISVGAGNRFGHPTRAALDRLAGAGAAVWRTDRGGTVTIRSDGRYFGVAQGGHEPLLARVRCQIRAWLPSRASSSSRSACTPTPPASSPTSFTTWPSRPR